MLYDNLHANTIHIEFWSKNQAESDRGQKGWAYGLHLEITEVSFSYTCASYNCDVGE